MAVGSTSHKNEGKCNLFSFLYLLSAVQIILGVFLFTYCYSFVVHKFMYSEHCKRYENSWAIRVILGFSLYIIIHYTFGIKIIYSAKNICSLKCISKILSLWLIIGLLVTLNGAFMGFLFLGIIRDYLNFMEQFLYDGIRMYLMKRSWKRTIDEIQIELECCGVKGASDWHNSPWIYANALNRMSETYTLFSCSDGDIRLPIAPFSCCNPNILTPCFHDPVQQTIFKSVWEKAPGVVEQSLYTSGCIDVLHHSLKNSFAVMITLLVLLFLFQVTIFICGRELRPPTKHKCPYRTSPAFQIQGQTISN